MPFDNLHDLFTLSADTAALVNAIRRDKYMQSNEREWTQTLGRVALSLLQGTEVDALYDAMLQKAACPAGRVMAGAGTDKNVTFINCFVAPLLQDSMKTDPMMPGLGIMDCLSNVAYSMQMGGGVGTDFSPLRPEGALVKRVNAAASGPLSFMHMWNSMCQTVMSAGDRRGAMMATLRCDHPDVVKFITAKHDPAALRMFNVSVLITDDFMRAKDNDGMWALGHWEPPFDESKIKGTQTRYKDEKAEYAEYAIWYVYEYISARKLWEMIMDSTYTYAEPGVIFIDKVNQKNNLYYCEYIQCSNPCFTGDTKVWTAEGHIPFKRLAEVGKDVQVLTLKDGRFVYRTMRNPRLTRPGAQIVEVVVTRPGGKGSEKWKRTIVKCTPKHVFYLTDGTEIQARNLVKGMRISSVYRSNRGKGYLGLKNHITAMMEHHVPFEGVEGLGSDIDAHHLDENKHNNRPSNLELKDHGKHSAEHKFGANNPMNKHPEKNWLIQQDHSGENNGRYRSDIDDNRIKELRNAGLSIAAIAYQLDCSVYTISKRLGWKRPGNHQVVSVQYLDIREDVYCGTVDDTGTFYIADDEHSGILVHNCGEQMLPPDQNCNLSHLNLSRCTTATVDTIFTPHCFWDGAKIDQTARILTRMGDSVIDLTPWPTERQHQEAKLKRRIGIGFTGLANALMFRGIRYGSPEAQESAADVMQLIRNSCYRESIELAREKGPFPAFDKDKYLSGEFIKTMPEDILDGISQYGIRNALLNTIAPTGTISIASADNASGGIEPVFDPVYMRKVLQADNSFKSYRAEDFGFRVYANAGYDGDFDAMMADKKNWPDFMVTVPDLKPDDHLYMQAAVQQYVDSSISKTINCPEDLPFNEFANIYTKAYELGCKGCTTYRPVPASGRGSVLSAIEAKKVILEEVHDLTKRPRKLPGETYKLEWGEDSALYLTFNDRIEDGKSIPYEFFINTKSPTHHDYQQALARMISAVMRKGGDVRFIAKELSEIHSKTGGEWIDGTYVPSVISLMGITMMDHFREIGYIERDEWLEVSKTDSEIIKTTERVVTGSECPSCRQLTLIRQEGCWQCTNCTYNKCG